MKASCHLSKWRRMRSILDVLLLLVTLPLVGVVAAGKPIRQYLEFPPLTQYVPHAEFAWLAFIVLALFALAVLLPFIIRILRRQLTANELTMQRHAFPWWGWLGMIITGVSWLLAWTRFEWFAPLQAFTFSPLWFGYILMVNAWTFRRSGRCMLRDKPGYTAALFVLSALFWWYFEYLNRFVQNWYYVGLTDLSKMQYFVYATLPFSTVLPAVLGTRDLLETWPALSEGLHSFIFIRVTRPRVWAWVVLLASCAGLAAVGVWPDILFPLLWLAPLLVITSLQCIRGQRTIFAALERGNWRNIVLLAAR